MRRRTTTVAMITVAGFLAIAVIAAVAIQVSYNSQLSTETSRLAATAQVTAELMAQRMNSVAEVEQATLGQAGFVSAVGSGDPSHLDLARLQTMLDETQALRPEFQFAAYSDAFGATRATSPADPTVIGRNFSYRDWYQGVTRTGRTYVSDAYVSAIRGAPLVVAVASPVRASGAGTGPIIGVLFIGYKIGSVQAYADRLAAVQKIDLQVTDQDGVILTRPGGIAGHLTQAAGAPEVTAALAGRPTTVTSATAIGAGAPVTGIGWTVSASTPLSAAAAAADRTTLSWIAAGALALLAVAGVVVVVVTRRLEGSHLRNAASEAELRTVQHALTDGIQVFGRDGTMLSRNPAAVRLFEGDVEGTTAQLDAMWEVLNEDGSPMRADQRPLATAMRTGETSEGVVVGIRGRASQAVKWLSISTVVIPGPGGEPAGYVSCSRDITDRTEALRELQVISRASEQLNSSLIPAEVIGALTSAAAELCSARGEPQRRAVLFLIDGDEMTMTGENDHERPGESSRGGVRFAVSEHPHVRGVVATGQPVVAEFSPEDFGPAVGDAIRQFGIRNGALVPLTRGDRVVAVLAVSGRQHALVGAVQLEHLKTLATIGALALSNAEAHELVADQAHTDPLTGVANRRALELRLSQLPRNARIAVVAIDVNDLKTVNDTQGHPAGDELLAKVAVALAAELRPSDILARTGGDEFVAVLVECDARGARELGRRLQRAVSRIRLAWGTPSISVGCAAGAVGDSPEKVSKAADVELYAAKERRKPRVA